MKHIRLAKSKDKFKVDLKKMQFYNLVTIKSKKKNRDCRLSNFVPLNADYFFLLYNK